MTPEIPVREDNKSLRINGPVKIYCPDKKRVIRAASQTGANKTQLSLLVNKLCEI